MPVRAYSIRFPSIVPSLIKEKSSTRESRCEVAAARLLRLDARHANFPKGLFEKGPRLGNLRYGSKAFVRGLRFRSYQRLRIFSARLTWEFT
jgi:hypothetical protein